MLLNSPALVSIIVPCYKQAEYLPEALNSILNQSYKNWECIIVDDGSPDNTEEVARKWCLKDIRFCYLKKENGGLSSARNAGIKLAKGDFIQLLDSDDLLEEEKLDYQIKTIEQNKNIDIIYSGSKYFFDELPHIFYNCGRNGMIPTINLDKTDLDQVYPLLWRNVTTICSTLYRKSVFEIGYFNENFKSLEDWEFHFRCAVAKKKFHFIKKSKTNSLIRLHEKSMLTNQDATAKAYEMLIGIFKSNLSEAEITSFKDLGVPECLKPKKSTNLFGKFKNRLWRILRI